MVDRAIIVCGGRQEGERERERERGRETVRQQALSFSQQERGGGYLSSEHTGQGAGPTIEAELREGPVVFEEVIVGSGERGMVDQSSQRERRLTPDTTILGNPLPLSLAGEWHHIR